MLFRFLAGFTVCVHLAFILFAIAGGLMVLRWRKVAWIHLPAVVWAAAIEFGGWLCPLTYLENWLWVQGGLASYGSGFVERYLLPILYPKQLNRSIQYAIGGLVLVLNLLIYFCIISRRRKLNP